MATEWKSLSIEDWKENPFTSIGRDWMLVTAGSLEDWNTMTAAWGGLGYLWNRDVSFAFVRPNRHTFLYTEKYEYYTLSFFPEKYRDALNYCGTHSGRDVNKAEETGLTPLLVENKSVSFAEAKLVLLCRKVYARNIDPSCFIDKELDTLYPGKQYHRMYVGEVETLLAK